MNFQWDILSVVKKLILIADIHVYCAAKVWSNIFQYINTVFWGGRLGVDEIILKIFVFTFGCWCWTSFHDVGTKRVFSLLVVIKVTVAPNSVCLLFWRKHTVASPLLYLYLWIFVFVDICMCISSSFQRGAEGGKEKNWLSPSITTSALRTAQLPSYWTECKETGGLTF